MGIHAFPAKTLGQIPTYYITDTEQEDAGSGNIRILNFARMRGVLVPQFQCIVASHRLVAVSRNLTELAREVLNSDLLRLPGMKVH